MKNKGQTEFEFDGYDRSTVVERISDSQRAYELISRGNLFQVNEKLMKELISKQGMIEDQIKKHPAIFLSLKNDFTGLLAGKKTNGEIDSFLYGKFDTSETALENFTKNLHENKKFLEENFRESDGNKAHNQFLSKAKINFSQKEL